MFKALKTIKKIKQLQKSMHDASAAFLLVQVLGFAHDSEESKAKAQTMHDISHMIKDILDGKSVDEAMTRLEITVETNEDKEVEQEDDEN